MVHHNRPFGDRQRRQVGIVLGHPLPQMLVGGGLQLCNGSLQPFGAHRVQGMKPGKHLAEPAGQVGPVAVGRFQRWQRLQNALDALCDQVPQCEWILDDAHLRPLRDAGSSALNGERVEQSVEEHRVHKRTNIRMLKRHVGLGKEVRRCRLAGPRSRETKA
ncbi:MAG: hypothetical protein AW09_002660 [Candidatus Accumulibacter phosphatis]|uniref:Uncharacterized protein n=1 Tax=Candidatus Accumulibacter phosphatis TaxID=327160 RepID=A0A080LUI2_9PROT|nr:MAG: hypothetical protein AW09_002660 [Candidatus Accumulibacter phosphatis]